RAEKGAIVNQRHSPFRWEFDGEDAELRCVLRTRWTLVACAEGLLITADHLLRLSFHFKSAMDRTRRGELRAHLLDLRRLLVEAISEPRDYRLEVFLLLSHR